MNTPKGTPTVSYLRVSSANQVEGDGFPRQREAIARHAKRNGLELVAEYRDEGVSGTLPLAERQGLAELLHHIMTNGVRVVLVEKSDRLARDSTEGELILRELRSHGVRVVEAEGGTDLTKGDGNNPTAKLVRQILGVVAEFEKDALVLKLRAARARKRRDTGRCEGRKPFGYFEGEDMTLREMKRLRRKNPRTHKQRSFAAVADALNAKGLLNRDGKPWARSSVHAILSRRHVGCGSSGGGH